MTRTTRHLIQTEMSLSENPPRARKVPPIALSLCLFALILITAACNMNGANGNMQTSGNGGNSGNTGGGSTTTAPNVVPVSVSSPTIGLGPYNLPLTTVTVCVPGTSDCQTIDGILVDTGSSGLRIFSSALTVSLPAQTNQYGDLFECVLFARSFTWGPLVSADIQISGEMASAATMNVIGSSNPPSGCGAGQPYQDSPQTAGFNGILGVNNAQYDCGSACIPNPQSGGNYYVCTSGNCGPIGVPLSQQVANPVSLFATDNNGVILELPAIPAGGATNVTGSLIFGIGTQSNNELGAATVYPLNQYLLLTANFQGQNYPLLVDSGSNLIGFLDPTTTGEPVCGGLYCPPSTESVGVTLSNANSSTTINFNIANASSLSGNNAYNDIVGPTPGAIDLGLPFFFGRNVFVAIQGMNTPSGTGPFWAF